MGDRSWLLEAISTQVGRKPLLYLTGVVKKHNRFAECKPCGVSMLAPSHRSCMRPSEAQLAELGRGTLVHENRFEATGKSLSLDQLP
jgi:hypothetical protein